MAHDANDRNGWKADVRRVTPARMAGGYRYDPESDGTGITVGAVFGCLTAIAFVSTVGLMVLFVVSWGCAHGAPCPAWKPPLAWLLVGVAAFAIFWVVRRIADALWAAWRRKRP